MVTATYGRPQEPYLSKPSCSVDFLRHCRTGVNDVARVLAGIGRILTLRALPLLPDFDLGRSEAAERAPSTPSQLNDLVGIVAVATCLHKLAAQLLDAVGGASSERLATAAANGGELEEDRPLPTAFAKRPVARFGEAINDIAAITGRTGNYNSSASALLAALERSLPEDSLLLRRVLAVAKVSSKKRRNDGFGPCVENGSGTGKKRRNAEKVNAQGRGMAKSGVSKRGRQRLSKAALSPATHCDADVCASVGGA